MFNGWSDGDFSHKQKEKEKSWIILNKKRKKKADQLDKQIYLINEHMGMEISLALAWSKQ